MGLMDILRGRNKNQPQEDEASARLDAFEGEALRSSEREQRRGRGEEEKEGAGGERRHMLFDEASATSVFGSEDSNDSGRVYNPYAGLGAALDHRDVKGPFRLPKEPEFLFSEEALVHQRSWSENLTYYTGSGYLLGAVAGGGAGAYRTLLSPASLTPAGLPSQRLRLNQLLNTSGKLGRSAGNALGVVGLFFASSESFLRNVNDGVLPDESATLGAGVLTGALYRSVRGPRQAAAAAVVGLMGASVLLVGRKYVNPGL